MEPCSSAAATASTSGFVVSCARQDVGDHRPAFGERAGLVDDEARQAARLLQRCGVADDDTHLRAASRAHHDRRRRGESQRAWTGDHEHRHGVHERARRIVGEPPHREERHDRDGHDGRDEDARDTVGETLDRRLRALRLRDEAHDAREQRGAADPRGLALEQAILVGRTREDLGAGRFRHRYALTRQRGLVDAGAAVADDPVHGDVLAGTDDEAVAGHDLVERNVDNDAIATHVRILRLQAQQAFERRRRACLGARFQQLAEQHQRDHGGAGLEVDVLVQRERGHDRAECPGHRRAEHDQHVHVRAAAAQRVPRADIEAPADIELDGGGEQKLQPARHDLLVRGAREHRQHLREERHREERGHDELALERRVRRSLARLVLGARLCGIQADVRVITGPFDGGDQRGGIGLRRIELRHGRLGREVHRGVRAGNAVQHLLDPRCARGARHPLEAELDA